MTGNSRVEQTFRVWQYMLKTKAWWVFVGFFLVSWRKQTSTASIQQSGILLRYISCTDASVEASNDLYVLHNITWKLDAALSQAETETEWVKERKTGTVVRGRCPDNGTSSLPARTHVTTAQTLRFPFQIVTVKSALNLDQKQLIVILTCKLIVLPRMSTSVYNNMHDRRSTQNLF